MKKRNKTLKRKKKGGGICNSLFGCTRRSSNRNSKNEISKLQKEINSNSRKTPPRTASARKKLKNNINNKTFKLKGLMNQERGSKMSGESKNSQPRKKTRSELQQQISDLENKIKKISRITPPRNVNNRRVHVNEINNYKRKLLNLKQELNDIKRH